MGQADGRIKAHIELSQLPAFEGAAQYGTVHTQLPSQFFARKDLLPFLQRSAIALGTNAGLAGRRALLLLTISLRFIKGCYST